MVRRLVVGCGSIGHAIVEALSDRPGDLLVVDESANHVETLRNEGITAERAAPGEIGSIVDAVDVVLAFDDDPTSNLVAARAAREAYPGAHVIAYTGFGLDPGERESFRAVADTVLDPGQAVADVLFERIGEGTGVRLRGLKRVVRNAEGPLGVFTHDDPDPDAIGSAIALVELAEALGVEAHAHYFGEIAHQENRALVNLLDLDLERLEPEEFDPGAFGAIALVDHSRPGVNDSLPPDTPIDLVIDHHPPRGPIEAGVLDIQSDVGATSTLLAEYFRGMDRDPSERVATALLYGIRVDTRDFGREITGGDFEAAAFLLPYAQADVLERVESPSVSGDTLDTVARAIENYRREGTILISGVGRVNNRDAIAQAADRLLAMEGITAVVVFGFMEGVAYVSGRTRGADLDIGETMRRAFDPIGSAGGHSDMAGAQLPLGILGDVEDGEGSLEAVLTDVIAERFFEVVGIQSPPEPLEVDRVGGDAPAE